MQDQEQLLNYVLVCKESYAKREECIKSLKYTQSYDGDYFADLLNSYIIAFKDGQLIMSVSRLNEVFVNNTYKLILHSHNVGYQFNPSDYFHQLIHTEFGYKKSTTCEEYFAKICEEKWWSSNINLYDIYKIIYHLHYKKYRLLSDALERFTFSSKDIDMKNTLDVLSALYDIQSPTVRTLQAIMSYLIYCHIMQQMTVGYERYMEVAIVLYHKREKLQYIHELPLYIKRKMIQKYIDLFKNKYV
jgi:hypothetical protein